MLVVVIYVITLFSFGSPCKWPTSDVLFIIDSTLNLNVYEQLDEVSFIRKAFQSMSISPTNVHVAVAQYTPKGRVEFNLDASQSNDEAESRLQGVSYIPCDPFSKIIPCTPVATLNSLAKQGLLPGNRRTVPDVIVVVGSSKYSLPYVGSTEVLFLPVSPIHAFQITVGGPSPTSDTFEPAATLIRMHALDFDSLEKLADPLCESVSSFIGNGNITSAHFGSFCWLVIGILILFLVVLSLICIYLFYSFRKTETNYKKRLAESDLALRKQNEYFTAKIHAQMEEQIATNKQHVEDFKKQQEALQGTTMQHLELHRQLQNSQLQNPQVSPSIPTNNSNSQPIPLPLYSTRGASGDKTLPIIQRPKQGDAANDNDNTIHLTIDGREVEVNNGKFSTRFVGDADGKQTTVQFQNNGSNREVQNRDGRNDHVNLQGKNREDQKNNADGKHEGGDNSMGDRARLEESDELTNGTRVHGKSVHVGEGKSGRDGDLTRHGRETSEELNHERIRVSDAEFDRYGRSRTDPRTSRREKHHVSRLNLKDTDGGAVSARHPNWSSDDTGSTEATDDSVDSSVPAPIVGSLPPNHPARNLPPVDILFLVDSSSSIGITIFDAMKENIIRLLNAIDIAPGRSRVGLIQYAQEPNVVFGFDKYYSISNVKKGVNRMSYTGGPTMLSKALSFAAGVLYNEQNMKEARKRHKLMPTPRHDRLQILCVCSDGGSDDNTDKATNYIHEKLQIKVLGMVSKSFNKEKLLPVTRFDGSVFVMTQTESMSIWIWRQQKLWAENYSTFLERSKTKTK